MGRPSSDSKLVRARLEQRPLRALYAYATSVGPVTRPPAILVDWFVGRGFMKHREDPEGAN